jgi:hypothetical protein
VNARVGGREGSSVAFWVAAAALVMVGSVGCAASGSSPMAGGSGGASGGGTGGAASACVVTLSPVTPASFTGLRAGDTLRVRATTNGPVAATATWSWSVTAADGSAVPTVQPTVDAALIDVTLPSTGTYAITARYGPATSSCSGSVHVTIAPAGARAAFFVFRLTPPPGLWPAQQLPPITVMGGTPSGGNILKLDEGTPVLIAPREQGGAGGPGGTSGVVASYVRAVEQSSGLVTEAHAATTTGSGRLQLPPGLYDVLVVPDGLLAPLLLTSRRPTDLGAEAIVLDAGMAVTGKVTDAAGTPIAGTRIGLRAGALPSTLGTSDAGGNFTLRVRPGTYGATIVPGAAMPGTELSIAASPGITIAGKPPVLSLRLATLATARIGLTVSGAGSGAKILVEARDPVAAAAMVEMASGETITMAAATMRVRAELPIAATGAVTIGPLPRAHYRATVFAPAGSAATAGATVATIATLDDIDATGGDVQRAVTMGTPVAISGTLRPGPGARTARVQAIDDDASAGVSAETVAPFVTQADDSGAFSVKVNPSRRYRLIVDPPSGGAFARAVLPSVTVAGTPVAVGAQELPAALLYAGRVVGPHLEPAPGTVVTAFCVGTAPACVDPTRPIAEAVTTDDGSFRLMLPDPGVGP